MRAGRVKLASIVGILLGSGLALLAWSQPWFEVVLASGATSAAGTSLSVTGQVAAPALSALALAGLALGGALTIAGPLIRVVLGLLGAVLGGCIVLAASVAIADPIAAVSASVAEATGVAGGDPTAELVAQANASAWPAVAVAGGAIVVLAAVWALVTARSWPASRRHGGVRLAADGRGGAAGVSDRAVDDWDDLSRGDDPTHDPA
ncbi:Trp biosynthesis-associated membrane protein [Agromyces marinus]|uniref:Tryptophan-associated transmembrane protein (Trp_oprn_chp) n=1 Tax=Agromyces marinus TaxID=1389020 RepID=A0ABM8GWW8_9MICO|nr:Trp biosynthesis-associated membrane protein [Agromyces marinus]UIP58725.1 hypothetical protein DSM26151_16060 [Agromyces marinus]BDZ52970.1 hypothetical protein GCM10025870_00430 [Agromyces marinus]BDZ56341.1 hypothetical protein GCM10025870_34140 [Agromyces marinus]